MKRYIKINPDAILAYIAYRTMAYDNTPWKDIVNRFGSDTTYAIEGSLINEYQFLEYKKSYEKNKTNRHNRQVEN